MKSIRLGLIFLSIVCCIFTTNSFAANESSNNYTEKITGYAIDAKLDNNGVLSVKEKIDYDFGSNKKRGIYRYIPTIYKSRNGNPRQSITNISVKMNNGNSVPYTVTKNTSNKQENVQLNIGDSNKLVTGIQTYIISYDVARVVSSDRQADTFNWNFIGTQWEVPINNIRINLKLSAKSADNLFKIDCYTGENDNTQSCNFSRDNRELGFIKKSIESHKGITIHSSFKIGTFKSPGWLEILFWEKPWYYFLPIITLLIYLTIWVRIGRNTQGRGTVVPMYDAPRDLPPTESSLILYGYIKKCSLSAEIIFLAIKGYLKVKKLNQDQTNNQFFKPDYQLIKIRKPDNKISIKEQQLLDALFSNNNVINISDLSQNFMQKNNASDWEVCKKITREGYFTINPIFAKGLLIAISFILIIAFGILGIYLIEGTKIFLILLMPGLIALIFSLILPEQTSKGLIAKEDLLGLKMYIKAAEIDRIKFHNAPEKNSEKFEELLPYAIILGLENEWAKQFEPLYLTPPNWYQDNSIGNFSATLFANDISHFSNIASITMAPSVSNVNNVDGNFNGGGGGGGGSW